MPSTASQQQELAGPSPVAFHFNPPGRIQGYGNPLWHSLEQTLYAILFQDEEYLASGPDGIASETTLSPGKNVWGSMADICTINEACVNHVHAAIKEIINSDNDSDYDSNYDPDTDLRVARGQRAGSDETIIDDLSNIDQDYVLTTARRNLKGNNTIKRRLTDDTDDEYDFAPSSSHGTSNSREHSSKKRKLEPAANLDKDLNSEPRGVSLRTATPSPDPIPRKEKTIRQTKKMSPNGLPHMSGKRLPPAAINATVAAAAVTRVKWEDHEGVAMFEALKSFQLGQHDRNEPLLKDLNLYNKIAEIIGGGRSAGSCKNYWTRTGRSRFQWDEKKGRHSADVSPTCVQSKKEKKNKQGISNN